MNINEFRNNSYKREVKLEFEERCKVGVIDVLVNIQSVEKLFFFFFI